MEYCIYNSATNLVLKRKLPAHAKEWTNDLAAAQIFRKLDAAENYRQHNLRDPANVLCVRSKEELAAKAAKDRAATTTAQPKASRSVTKSGRPSSTERAKHAQKGKAQKRAGSGVRKSTGVRSQQMPSKIVRRKPPGTTRGQNTGPKQAISTKPAGA